MRPTSAAALLILAATILACATRPAAYRPQPAENGSFVLVYRTDVDEAAGVVVEAVAVREDGRDVPLTWNREHRAGRPGTVAWGSIPAGRYRGLAVRVAPRRGGLDGERVDVAVPFTVASGQGRAVLVDLASGRGTDEDEGEATGRPVARGEIPANRMSALLGVVPMRRAGALLLFDRVSGEIAGAVPTGRGPVAATVDVLASRAYVALADEDAVEIVDLAAPASIGRIALAVGDQPSAIARSADGRTVVTANRGSATLSILDPDARLERSRVAIGDRPTSVALDPDGRTAYVTTEAPPSLAVVDLATASILGRVPLESGPIRLRLDAAGRRIVVAHRESRVVLVVNPSTRTVVRRIPLDSEATAVALDPRSDRFYVARRGGMAVEAFEPGSPFPTRGYPVDGEVRFLEVDTEGNTLCMVLPDRGEIRLVRLVGGQVFARLGVGPEPGEPAFSGSR